MQRELHAQQKCVMLRELVKLHEDAEHTLL